jgi:hypothetical protein
VGAIRVKHEEYNGNMSAKVAYCIARSRQENLAPWKNTGATPAQAPVEQSVTLPDDMPFDMA